MSALLLSLALASAAAADGATAPSPAPDARDLAEAERLRGEMALLARRNAWAGVDRAYRELEAAGVPAELEVHDLGVQASRALGDAWGAYQRLIKVIANGGPEVSAHAEMAHYRDAYGRVVIRRIEEDAPISLTPSQAPFAPDTRLAISFAADQLIHVGAFDGMLPVGEYAIGPHTLEVAAGLSPTTLVRTQGDSDLSTRRRKRAEPPEEAP